MKKLIKTALSALLALTVGVVPTFAVGATDGGAETGSGANTVRKFTPVIDGVIDDEYLSSYHIDHEWPEERTPENYWAVGRYEFETVKDDTGHEIIIDGKPIYTGECGYGWDAQASSYFLWDDESIYIAVAVTDDDYGCIDEEHYEIALEYIGFGHYGDQGPFIQDMVSFTLSQGGQSFTTFATRDGRALYNINADGRWCDTVSWIDVMETTAESYYAVAETEDGYILEICMKVNDDVRADILRDGGSFDLDMVSVRDVPDDSSYIPMQEHTLADVVWLDDSWLLSDLMGLNAIYKTEDGSLTLTLSDEAAVGGDTNSDIELDFEIVYSGHNMDGNYGTDYPYEELFAEGLFILDDETSARVAESINSGKLSYGRVGDEFSIDPDTQCLAVVSVVFPYYHGDIENTVLSRMSINDGDITVTVEENYESHGILEAFTTFRFIVILEKEQLITLNENSRYLLDFTYFYSEPAEKLLEFPEIVRSYDINVDGAVDTKDLTRLMQVISGAEVEAAWTDVNGDGAVDVKDLTRMMKHLAGAEA